MQCRVIFYVNYNAATQSTFRRVGPCTMAWLFITHYSTYTYYKYYPHVCMPLYVYHVLARQRIIQACRQAVAAAVQAVEQQITHEWEFDMNYLHYLVILAACIEERREARTFSECEVIVCCVCAKLSHFVSHSFSELL